MVTVRPDKLRKLSERAEKLQEEITRLRALAAKEERRKEDRRKLLAGGVWLDLVERCEFPRDAFLQALDKHLSRPRDRELFGLPVDPEVARPTALEPAPTPVAQAAQLESRGASAPGWIDRG